MAINFPDTPSTGDTHTVGSVTWEWDGATWKSQGTQEVLSATSPLAYDGDTKNLTVDLSSYYTSAQADTAISTAVSNLVDSAPATLDTLNELAAALGDDANFATTVTNALAAKAPLRQSFEDKSANYTFDAADTNKVIRNTSGTAVTFTIPADTFTLGDRIDIINGATGVVTIAAGAGVTLLSKDSAVTIDTQHAAATLVFRDTNLVYLIGDLA